MAIYAPASSKFRLWALIFILFCGIAILVLQSPRDPWSRNEASQEALAPSGTAILNTETENRPKSKSSFLRLVVTAPQADARFCRTLISATALGYPTPKIINWRREFTDTNLADGGAQIAKIEGVLEFLESMPESADDDMVILLDNSDIWFQLPPAVLIARYQQIVTETDSEFNKRMGVRTDIKHKVVFSAQRNCQPSPAEHPACFAVPESRLPADTYRLKIDEDLEHKDDPSRRHRPRFLNAGSAMGPVSAMRDVFRRALFHARMDPNSSQQVIFAAIFGEQEFKRLQVERAGTTPLVRAWRQLLSKLRIRPETPLAGSLSGPLEDFELGIALDYKSELFQATASAEEDAEWIKYSDRARIQAISQEMGLTQPRIAQLPEDLRRTDPPFLRLKHQPAAGDPSTVNIPWDNVTLFTNKWTGISPAGIQYNTPYEKIKGGIESHWQQAWFFPRLRGLYQARLWEPEHEVASLPIAQPSSSSSSSSRSSRAKASVKAGAGAGARHNEARHTWWSVDINHGGVLMDHPQHGFSNLCDLCVDHMERILNDGQGPWKDTRFDHRFELP